MLLRHHSVPQLVFEAPRGMVVPCLVELRKKKIENQVPNKEVMKLEKKI
jgi:hypothetical protein